MHKSTKTSKKIIYEVSSLLTSKVYYPPSYILRNLRFQPIKPRLKSNIRKGGNRSCHEEVLASQSCHTLHRRFIFGSKKGKMGKDFLNYCERYT